MKFSSLFAAILSTLVLAAMSGCGGGGSGTSASSSASTEGPAGPDSFLLFPNPQKQDDASLEVNSTAYATGYYQAIDPANERTTAADFKTKNQFGTGGNEVSIIIGDQRDLGYGRKMTGRQNADGSIAFVVENYLVGGYGAYSSLSVEAAVVNEPRWHIGTNGIEFSVGPTGTTKFVKFYTFDPSTGQRLNTVNLDGRGAKAMPTVCISCHGGRGDPLTPTGLFPKLMSSVSGLRGDISAQAHPFEPAAFDYSTMGSYTRAVLESNMKALNKMVLCTYPIPASETTGTFDACRRTATQDEYQGTAAAHIKTMYGGNNLPNATSESSDSYMPGDWQSTGHGSLYSSSVTQACRVCHSLRGTGNQSDIDFESFTKFDGFADRIKAHVIDRGNMPLAKLVYDKFWTTSAMNAAMATYLTGTSYSADANKKPGRPVADPGPDRVASTAAVQLSAAMSLYSSSYQWSVVSGAGATLTNATTASPTLNTPGNGTYVVQLVTGSGGTQSTAATQTIKVDTTFVTPANFAAIKTILQAGGGGCTTCHASGMGVIPPIWYSDFDRNGDATVDATDTHWFYKELRGRINFTDIAASPLLRKPAGHHHNAGPARTGFDDSLAVGSAGRVDYDKILAWIVNGAPE
jgi:hypothetical protein